MYATYLLSLALAATSLVAKAGAKSVFAHYIVGNGYGMTAESFASDFDLAIEAGIDGFAMNIAAADPNTDAILEAAYTAADASGNFTLFLSFDYLSMGPWSAGAVIEKINAYKWHSSQFTYEGKPFVSTFEGVNNIYDWASIKAATGCFVVPSWTSLGPSFANYVDLVDGAFSWDAWPTGAADMDTNTDTMWTDMLAGKPYMMPASPWFYTNLPQWSKNWLWRGDDLWHDRWQQIIEAQPEFVEIITWNDFGETHYIGPVYEPGIPSGAQSYVNGMSHDGWRTVLPTYIEAYKNGNSTAPTVSKESISYWYRLNPGTSGSADGTTGNNPNQGQQVLPPATLAQDKVFVSVLVAEPSDVNVAIGSNSATYLRATTAGVNHFSVPFNGQTGNVTVSVSRNGQSIASTEGPAITDACIDGNVNWNAFAGSSS